MSCNNIEDISADMCNNICDDNISVSNIEGLNDCKSKCNQQILGELNPLDITNNFIFLNSADIAEKSLEIAAEKSETLYNLKKDSINALIDKIETEIGVGDSECDIKLGLKWKKIINGGNNNVFINVDYIKRFKKYSAFGIKWKNVGNAVPNSEYLELVNDTGSSPGTTITQDSYDYLRYALENGIKDSDNNILLKKIDLINNNLFINDDSEILKIYPNSYIKLSDDTYCKVSNYDISNIDTELKSIFNSGNDLLDFTTNDKFENTFSDLTIDDFIINESGDVYIPSVGCSDFENTLSCINIDNVLSQKCFVDNTDDDYIKRKDSIPYIFHNDSGCISKAFNFNNKNELYDIINRITFDTVIIENLNDMMGIYEETRYDIIKNRIDEILTDDQYSQYFTTNDFLSLFHDNVKYWIKIDNDTFDSKNWLNESPIGSYNVSNNTADLSNYDEIAKIISEQINANTPDNFVIQLADNDIVQLKELFKNINLESTWTTDNWFEITHENGATSKIILYRPLQEHIDIRESLYDNSTYDHNTGNSISGIDYYNDLNNGQKLIESSIIGEYGKIGNEIGFYTNFQLSDDYITNTQCESIKSNVLNTSNDLFITENIENRLNLDKYKLDESDFLDLTTELNSYNSNINNLDECILNSKTMIDLDTYTKTIEYDNIDNNITTNAEINKNYNTYLSIVNRYEDSDVGCKYLSEYNNLDTCHLPGEICLSDDFVSDTEYDNKFTLKKDALKEYIFNTQKNYYVGKTTTIDIDNLKEWTVQNTYPLIGLELENAGLRELLDEKFEENSGNSGNSGNPDTNVLTLSDTDFDFSTITLQNIDNNTYIRSSNQDRYYVLNLQQEDCNQPDNYKLQNSPDICDADEECAYKNEYTHSIDQINGYDDDNCTDKLDYLNKCYDSDIDIPAGKQIDYSTCRDDRESFPTTTDCPSTPDPECTGDSFITYDIVNGKYTCNKVCSYEDCEVNYHRSGTECLKCGYQTTSDGSTGCSQCDIPRYESKVLDDGGGISEYGYYDYTEPGCGTIIYRTCEREESSNIGVPINDAVDGKCPEINPVTGKRQFYAFDGEIERDEFNKPLLFRLDEYGTISDSIPTSPTQEEIREGLSTETEGNYQYIIDLHYDHKCKKSCISCNNNQKFVDNVPDSFCQDCQDNEVGSSNGLACVKCNVRTPYTIYDNDKKDCVRCHEYYLPDFQNDLCNKTSPGYYVECPAGQNTCNEVEADPNHIVLGQINIIDWLDTISEIIFDYETTLLPLPTDITNDINIIFKNVPSSGGSSGGSSDSILTFTKKQNSETDKYYRDISQNIIVFENTSETIPHIKYLDSIYISSSTNSDKLPNKIFMKTNLESYYLLTDSLLDDIATRYSTNTAKQIIDVRETGIEIDSYLIFDINLNISNDQRECPENTFVYVDEGINRNICKVYDSGYYRDTDGVTRIQTSCLNGFTDTNKATIDITESKLGGESGGQDYAGCIYKCNDNGNYYNEGLAVCEPCPVGYKCIDKQNMEPCNGEFEYQNELGQQVCKTIPTHGTAITHTDPTSDIITHVGFTIPVGKQYTADDNIISDCGADDYKDTPSIINKDNAERNIPCSDCPPHTTTKGQVGKVALADCIPDFGYDLLPGDNEATILPGYEDTTDSIKCGVGYYLGDFDGNCNPNRNECTECTEDEIDKACIACPSGYTCPGGSVDCTAGDKAKRIIIDGNIDDNGDNIIDSCLPGMKFVNGECQLCEYDIGELDYNNYCINGVARNYVTETSEDDIKLKNNDDFTPAVFITSTDNQNYHIHEITQDSHNNNNIIFKFKNNYIPYNIQDFSDNDILLLYRNGVPLYLYEYASGEKNIDTIENARNLTQDSRIDIVGNTIDLSNEGYITNKDVSEIIRTKIINNDLKFVGTDKDSLLDIIIEYKSDTSISADMNLSYIYELEYYDGTQLKTHCYVYKILPYPSQCDAGYQTSTGLIDSCDLCPRGTYKTDTSVTQQCINATGNDYVGLHNLVDLPDGSNPDGLGGISISTAPVSPGIEMLTDTDGGNYGYKLSAGYSYTANTSTISDCGTANSEEQILLDNLDDNTSHDYNCDSCPDVSSYTEEQKIGLVRTERDQSTGDSNCDIKVCDTNYMNIDDDNTKFCKLENCGIGHYFDDTVSDDYGQGQCVICPEGHYCYGTTDITAANHRSVNPTTTSHPKIECPANTYNPNTGSTLLQNCMSCPPNTESPAGSIRVEQCEAKPEFYGPPGQPAEQCPADTVSPPGSTRVEQCVAKSGFIGPPGEEPTPCPGNVLDSDIDDHKISTVSGECVYNRCPPGEFRNNQAQCQAYNDDINIESCPDGEIFIAGKQDNDSINYTEYTPGIEANYDIETMYGHDNLCLPKSDICAANSDDASLISVEYETCPSGQFRNNQAECQAYNSIDITSCSNDEIFIAGKQDNGSTYYTAYTPGIEADYNTPTIYGHDNLCLSKSEICY
jgi:hypothetical protein